MIRRNFLQSFKNFCSVGSEPREILEIEGAVTILWRQTNCKPTSPQNITSLFETAPVLGLKQIFSSYSDSLLQAEMLAYLGNWGFLQRLKYS